MIPSRRELVAALAGRHRPREDWRLGLEYEQFVTDAEGRPVPYEGARGVEAILKRLAGLTGWRPLEERGRVLGLAAGDGRGVTLEPGAQLEFNSSPAPDLASLEAQVAEYFAWLERVQDEFGVFFVALGAQPAAAPAEIRRIPKARYEILEPYLAGAGELGLWMMKATAGIQLSLDHGSDRDAARKMRVAQALAPVLNALFANSPVRAGTDSGFASWRGHVWTRTDPTRCGIVEAAARPESTLEDYAGWALAAPMLFLERDGALLDARGRTFAGYWERGFDGHSATLADWDLHLSTLFPEARFRPHLELRFFDSGCPRTALGVAALCKGTFYDEGALEAAWSLAGGWSPEQRRAAWHGAHRQGLAAPAPDGGTLLDRAARLVEAAVLPPEERGYLKVVEEIVSSGRSAGEGLRERFQGEWEGSVAALAEASRCVAARPASAP